MTAVADGPDRWPVPLSEPPAAPAPDPGATQPLWRVDIPGVEDLAVVGPGDVLVVRVSATVLPHDLEAMARALQVGPLAGRVLLVAAADTSVFRP